MVYFSLFMVIFQPGINHIIVYRKYEECLGKKVGETYVGKIEDFYCYLYSS